MASDGNALENDTRRISLATVYKLALDQSGKQVQDVLQHAIDQTDEERCVSTRQHNLACHGVACAETDLLS